jgi:putative phosphoribosyl transferase
MDEMRYCDRAEAGRLLAMLLVAYAQCPDILVLALPRGGVPVAYEVAKALHVPLDLFLVRKLGVPGQEELAMGALAIGGIRVFNADVVRMLRIPDYIIESVVAKEQRELERRERLYRDGQPPLHIQDRTVILVDDGLATGATMRAAVRALRQEHPARIIVAVPVAAPQTCAELRPEVDALICARMPEPFYGVGWWYENFAQISDNEVHALLTRSKHEKFQISSN